MIAQIFSYNLLPKFFAYFSRNLLQKPSDFKAELKHSEFFKQNISSSYDTAFPTDDMLTTRKLQAFIKQCK